MDAKEAGKKLAKSSAVLAVAAVATYGALKPEEAARDAIAQNAASHRALAARVEALQTWAKSTRELAEGASGACRTRVDNLTSFVTGYMLALSRAQNAPRSGRRSQAPQATPEEIKALVRALKRPATSKRPRSDGVGFPKLSPPPAAPQQRKE